MSKACTQRVIPRKREVCLSKHLCKFASALPARTFVEPRLREAATTLTVRQKEQFVNGKRYE